MADIIKLLRTTIEVGSPKKGKPSYRWTTGYYVINPETGQREYPPVKRSEAYIRAREINPKAKIIVEDDGRDYP